MNKKVHILFTYRYVVWHIATKIKTSFKGQKNLKQNLKPNETDVRFQV